MANTTKVRLWLMRETDKARLYCKFPPGDGDVLPDDLLWVPRSVVEHTSIRGDEHTIDLPDWFIEKSGL